MENIAAAIKKKHVNLKVVIKEKHISINQYGEHSRSGHIGFMLL